MSSALPNPRAIYNFDDLLEIEEITGLKYELLDGHIVAMTGGTKAHNVIALGLFTEIDAQKNPRCRLYVADVKLRTTKNHNGCLKDSVTYPDLMLACSEEDSDLCEEHPILIAKVLSDSTARKDKTDKKAMYLGLSSLQAYIVLSQTEIMMTFHQRKNDIWIEHIYMGKDSEVEVNLGVEHQSIRLNLSKIYKYLEDRI